MMHDRADGEDLTYTHEFLAHAMAHQSQVGDSCGAGPAKGGPHYLSSGKYAYSHRPGLEKASCECYAIVKKRFDDFLKPPPYAFQGGTYGRK